MFWPPIVFLVVLGAVLLAARLLRRLALPATEATAGKTKAYACGEDLKINRAQPDYRQFFPFAFFFTIMHVIALIVATAPVENAPVTMLAVVYVLASAIGVSILYRS